MSTPTKAPDHVQELVRKLKEQNHSPRLDEASVAVCFQDAKPFKKDRFNWGSVKKFPSLGKAFPGEHHDFVLVVPFAGYDMMTEQQKTAWFDLLLETCQVEHMPETVVVDKKKKVVTDEFGRKKYTNEIKRDNDGAPLWKKVPLDLPTFVANVKRFGCWIDEISEFRDVLKIKS